MPLIAVAHTTQYCQYKFQNRDDNSYYSLRVLDEAILINLQFKIWICW